MLAFRPPTQIPNAALKFVGKTAASTGNHLPNLPLLLFLIPLGKETENAAQNKDPSTINCPLKAC
jgi:hypothetical protein